MKKYGLTSFSGILVLLVFIGALLFFIFQSKEAVETINFHANLFEKRGTIVLDAGHGGEDGGAVGINGAIEKDINLAIALELEEILKQNNFDVIMIRDADYSVGDSALDTVAKRKKSDTEKRLETVMSAGECTYIGIHQNHFSQSKYYGAQIFYSGNNEASAILAECIRSSIVESLQPDNTRENKLAEKNIYILYSSQVPSVLVECGFISNQTEADKLCDPQYQKAMADAIYTGIMSYLETSVRSENENSINVDE